MKLKIALAVLVILTGLIAGYHSYDYYDDIKVAKVMTATYENQSKIVEEGLKQLAGKNGAVKWSTAKTMTSTNADLVYSTAIVTCTDITGKLRTCVFNFRVNHDTKATHLDSFFVDDVSKDYKDGLRIIVTGKLNEHSSTI